MDGNILSESSSFRLLGLPFSNNLSCRDYNLSIAKSAAMKVGSLYQARQFLTEATFYIYLWAAPTNCLNLIDRVQRRIVNIVGPVLSSSLDPLNHRRDISPLSLFFYRHAYNGYFSDVFFLFCLYRNNTRE